MRPIPYIKRQIVFKLPGVHTLWNSDCLLLVQPYAANKQIKTISQAKLPTLAWQM